MTGFERRMFEADLRACLARDAARKAENAAWRARCLANTELAALLLEDAKRRGEPGIDWNAYFVNLGIAS